MGMYFRTSCILERHAEQSKAVTRQFGLGTRLPWDESQLVESLSGMSYPSMPCMDEYLLNDF
jgi:hypothetical protein